MSFKSVTKKDGVTVSVTLNDEVLRRIVKDVERFGKLKLEIGYYAGENTYDDKAKTDVAAVALFHEFGTKNMPQRSFMRSAIKENRTALKKVAEKATAGIFKGTLKPEDAAATIARAYGKVIYTKLKWASSWATPLLLSTIKSKDYNLQVLFETGKLQESLVWRVVDMTGVVAEGKAKDVQERV